MRQKKSNNGRKHGSDPLRFEAVKMDSLFEVLDGVAWLDTPSTGQVAQFAGIDPRTAGKLLKNAREIGLVESLDINANGYFLTLPYPYKGTSSQKEAVVREALLRLPLLTNVRQFLSLGNPLESALRKAATVAGLSPYDPAALLPLVNWGRKVGALEPTLRAETLADRAVEVKTERQIHQTPDRVVFLSHSSKDKPFVRQLASDLIAGGVRVWLDEQRVRVGESIPEKVAQGLAESDYFLLVLSSNSIASEWVKKELNQALVSEIERRRVKILPVRIDASPIPNLISDKKYADFSTSYNTGLSELLSSIRSFDGD